MSDAALRLLPLVALVALVAVVALRWGRAAAELDETAAITALARRYVSEVPGGRPSDCTGRPGTGRVWLVVACASEQGARTWRLDRRGRILEGQGA